VALYAQEDSFFTHSVSERSRLPAGITDALLLAHLVGWEAEAQEDTWRADLRHAGFSIDHQRGSHQVWKHPLIPGVSANLAGAYGADAKPNQEQQVREALRRLEEAQRRQP
jgi:hypothetical protein